MLCCSRSNPTTMIRSQALKCSFVAHFCIIFHIYATALISSKRDVAVDVFVSTFNSLCSKFLNTIAWKLKTAAFSWFPWFRIFWQDLALVSGTQVKGTSIGLLWLLADFHCCFYFLTFPCKQSLATSQAVLNHEKMWHRLEMEKVCLQSKSCT